MKIFQYLVMWHEVWLIMNITIITKIWCQIPWIQWNQKCNSMKNKVLLFYLLNILNIRTLFASLMCYNCSINLKIYCWNAEFLFSYVQYVVRKNTDISLTYIIEKTKCVILRELMVKYSTHFSLKFKHKSKFM